VPTAVITPSVMSTMPFSMMGPSTGTTRPPVMATLAVS